MNRKFSAYGAVCCWDSKQCLRDPVFAAFDKVSAGHLVPELSPIDGLTNAAKRFADECELHVRGMPLRYRALDKESVGIEVRREIKGVKENQYPLMYSAGVNKTTGEVDILKWDADQCPVFTDAYDDAVAVFNNLYTDCCRYIEAGDLTEAVVALVKRSHGVLLRDHGSVYFVPDEHLPHYSSVADDLVKYGPKLHQWTVDLSANADLAVTIGNSVEESLMERVTKREQDMEELKQRGGKPRSNGMKTRFDEWCADCKQMEFYEQFLSQKLSGVREALERQRALVGEAGIEVFRHSA